MERVMERMRERGPVQQDTLIEESQRASKREKQLLSQKPHVLKNDKVPWTQGLQAYHKVWMSRRHFTEPVETWTAPQHCFNVKEQIIPPGSRSGKHHHTGEAVFYVMEGKGYEIHDDKEYVWEAGNIFCVPGFCTHQHFTTPDSSCHLFFVVQYVFGFLGLKETKQIEAHPDYKLPEESRELIVTGDELAKVAKPLAERLTAPKFEGKPRNTYDLRLKQLADDVQWRLNSPHIIQGSQRPWEDTGMGRLKYLLDSSIPSATLSVDAWVQEIPPGGRSGKHHHGSEEVHKILQGRGYDIHDGTRWDWEEKDVVFIPSYTVHQHFNADPRHPALFVSFESRIYSLLGRGGIEHLEDAS